MEIICAKNAERQQMNIMTSALNVALIGTSLLLISMKKAISIT